MNKNYAYLKNNKFAKRSRHNKTMWEKGHIPWNKGLKGIHLSPKSEWKKGERGIHWLPIGSKTIRIDKGKLKRRWIKIEEPNVWIEYAKFVWIKNNGKIPKGYLIHHIDKNAINDNIDNLALVTRKAHINIHRSDLNKGRGIVTQDKLTASDAS